MRNLTSADLLCIDNKPVFTFKGVAGLNPRTLLNEPVCIDGHEYDVLRVETYAVMDPTGMNFGLMVKRAG